MRIEKHLFSYVTAILVAFLICLNLSVPANADDTEEAQLFIRDISDRAFVSIAKIDLSYEERQSEFRALLDEALDIDYVARFVLGPYSKKASDAQLATFSEVLESYIVHTYAYRFKEFQVKELQITDAAAGKSDTIIVKSDVILPNNNPSIRVDWRVHKIDSNWKIIDIAIEGLSMMAVQREEYVAVIRQGGGDIDYLIAALEKKNIALASRGSD